MNIRLVRNAQRRWWADFGVHHRSWLRELAGAYKARGQFPTFVTDIADAYTDSRDRDVALALSLLVAENGKVSIQHQTFRRLMGAHPWEWFERRDYVSLCFGGMHEMYVDGNSRRHYWEVAALLGALWEHWHSTGKFILSVSLPSGVRVSEYNLRMAAMKRAEWHKSRKRILCPNSVGVRSFLNMWWPFYSGDARSSIWSFDEGVSLMGMERDTDFFYAYLGWQELRLSNSKACALYTVLYNDWLESDSDHRPSDWKKHLPKVVFG